MCNYLLPIEAHFESALEDTYVLRMVLENLSPIPETALESSSIDEGEL